MMSPDELREIGTLLYGERWQAPLAADLGVGDRTVRFWASNGPKGREIPPGAVADIYRLAETRRADLDAWLLRTGALQGGQR